MLSLGGMGVTFTPEDDGLRDAELRDALRETPRGAFALAGLTVGLLMLAWFAMYVFVFLPRGSVG
jgi:hypothetical protein